jgi:cation-transporting ATPase E
MRLDAAPGSPAAEGPPSGLTPPSPGLSTAQVAARIRSGAVNRPVPTGRRYRDIVRDNVLTPVNAVLAGLLVISLMVSPLQDATFGAILFLNILISLVQELRAKRTLDRLAIVGAAGARAVRDGRLTQVGVGEIVIDDLIELGRGDQAVVDMAVLESSTLEMDESLLTGESRPVAKRAGDRVLGGSSVSSGSASCRVTAVADGCYANSVVARARRHHLMGSALRSDLNRLLLWLIALVMPTAGILLYSELQVRDSLTEALRGAVAGTVAMVPEGLILLTSMTFAVGVLRLSRRGVLVQELPAMEMLARADVLCIDKTGTLTQGTMAVAGFGISPTASAGEVRAALGALARLEPQPSPTMRAVADRFAPPPPGWATEALAFSSQRGWSGVRQSSGRWWVLGGADVLRPADPSGASLPAALLDGMGRGERLLVLASTDLAVAPGDPLPGLRWEAAIGLTQPLRSGVQTTLGYFADQGVSVLVLSGDNPVTVAAVAGEAGLAGAIAADARELPDGDLGALEKRLGMSTAWGRVRPEQKQVVVDALRARGHTVAMLGDGVNDVLALRAADIGIAIGSGSPAARAASRAVLLDDDFGRLPSVVAEGRRLIGNVERVSKLFLSKTAYAVVLALVVALLGLPFPFWSRHLTLVGALTVGIPGFVLALAPNASRVLPGSLPRAVRFAAPAGAIAGAATLVGYHLVDGLPAVPFGEAQTVATLTLTGVGLWVVSALKRPLGGITVGVLAAMLGALAAVLAVPWGRAYFGLELPPAAICLAVLGVVAAAGLLLEVLLRLRLLGGTQR